MQKLKIRQEDGKFKKWFRYTVTWSSVLVILSVGIAGICISGAHPYSDIVSSKLISKIYNQATPDEIIISKATPSEELAKENIEFQIKNYSGAKNETYIDETWFAPYIIEPITHPYIGSVAWFVITDEEDITKYEQYFYIDKYDGTLNVLPSISEGATVGDVFYLYIFVNVIFDANTTYNFGDRFLESDPLKVVIGE